jgi:hypothetical protein
LLLAAGRAVDCESSCPATLNRQAAAMGCGSHDERDLKPLLRDINPTFGPEITLRILNIQVLN